jgi:xanthine dehydrogenase accessory factor
MKDIPPQDSTIPAVRTPEPRREDLFLRISELRRIGKPFALATVVHAEESTPRSIGARMIVLTEGSIEGTVGGGALEKMVIENAIRMLAENRSERVVYDLGTGRKGVATGMICGGRVEVLIESFRPGTTLFIFGAGHVGRKLAELADLVAIPYWMVDNRETYAVEELFPGAMGVVCAEFRESFARLPIDENGHLIIVTYGHQYDGLCLEEALKTPARYIGMIGSRKKVVGILESLSAKGVPVNDERIFAPIGLELGDDSPGQIGISILAEILKLTSGGSGRHMREANA